MNTRLLTLFVTALPSALCAQNLTVTVAAASASTLSATLGGTPQTASVQAGPLGTQGARFAADSNAAGQFASSEVLWNAAVDAYSIQVFLDASVSVSGAVGGQADSGPHDLLVTLSSPTPVPITFALTRMVAGTPGNELPVTSIDVGDDGTFELDETGPPTVDEYVVVGPAPLSIRCRFSAAAVGVGNVYAGLRLSGTPGDAVGAQLLPGCTGLGFATVPRLDGDLDYWVNVGQSGLVAAALGLEVQPLYLGNQPVGPFGQTMPCVLMPRPDLVVLLPSLAPQKLVVPPAARPLTVFSQAVLYDGVTLRTSNAYQTSLF